MLSDLLSDAWTFFAKHFTVIASTVLVISVPLHLIQSLFVDYRGTDIVANDSGLWQATGWDFFGPSGALILAIGGLVGIVIPLSVARLTERLHHGEMTTWQTALRLGFQKWGSGFLTLLLMGVLLTALFILLIIPGLIFAVWWIFTIIIVALTDKRLFDAMNYSRELVRGRWWKLFGYALVMALISMVVLWAVGWVFGIFGSNYVADVAGNIISDIVGAFFIVAGVMLFRNLERVTHAQSKNNVQQPS